MKDKLLVARGMGDDERPKKAKLEYDGRLSPSLKILILQMLLHFYHKADKIVGVAGKVRLSVNEWRKMETALTSELQKQ